MATFFAGLPIGGAITAPSLTGGYSIVPMGYDQHWSFGVQRQLPANSVLEVNYMGNRGVNLSEGIISTPRNIQFGLKLNF